jgi:hypothetical protein
MRARYASRPRFSCPRVTVSARARAAAMRSGSAGCDASHDGISLRPLASPMRISVAKMSSISRTSNPSRRA